MNSVHIIRSLVPAESLQKASMVSLKPGQLLYGTVENFLPNNKAIIRIGDMRLFASLQADLPEAAGYWFEVRSTGEDGLELKLVEGKGQRNSGAFLLDSNQLPETKLNLQLAQFFLSKNIPVTKEQLRLASDWIGDQTDSAKALTALEWMIKNDLPFTQLTFKSLVAVQQSESLSHQLGETKNFLNNPSFSSLETIQSLKEIITSLTKKHSIDDVGAGTEVKQLLKTLVQSVGLEYEHQVRLWPNDHKDSLEQLHSLKQLVIGAMTELGDAGKELEPLVNRLTGMQLISQEFNGPMQQIVMQLPLSFGGKESDATIQWSGRKTKTGQIDSNYCRILFYLDLQSLNQTVVDMQIQNRVVHLSVINDSKGMESIVNALTPILNEKLASVGYTLSFIKVNPSFETRNLEQFSMIDSKLPVDIYQRVDMKV